MREEIRVATLTLEIIEKRGFSFNRAFKIACNKAKIKNPYIKLRSYEVAYKSLTKVYLSDYYLKLRGFRKLHLRRKCAFRVAFSLVFINGLPVRSLSRYTGGLLPRKLLNILGDVDYNYIDQMLERLNYVDRLSIKYSHPKWLVSILASLFDHKELEALLKANDTPTKWIRVNTLKISAERGYRKLESQGLVVEPDRDFPNLYKVIKSKRPLDEIKGVKEGYFIIQDKASVAAVYELDPSPGDIILDATAAPGLKTQLIAELTEDQATLIATDISEPRLRETKKLLNLYNVKNVDIVLSDSTKIKCSQVDKVLIDPPCSNSGAIRRDPALRISLRDISRLNKYVSIQESLIKNISSINVNDYIVYSTCSLLPNECEAVIDKLVDESILLKCNVRAIRGYKGFFSSNYTVRYFPHIHDTIGFFISKFLG